GCFPHRFLGWSRVMATAEYRAQVSEFDFFSLWHVLIDAAVFTEVGRVFMSSKDMKNEFGLTTSQTNQLENTLRVSYGGGLRFALSQALIARIDVGFSEEKQGLVYLTFGHTF